MKSLPLLALLAAFSAAPAFAADAPLTQGEIRKVDKDAKKLTIRHGEIKNLDMPAMTMTFRVHDSAVLNQVKVGDKVRFAADKKDGALIVTKLERDR